MELKEREKKIFKEIMKTFLETRKEVSSLYLEKKTKLNISASTIRNSMNDLEEVGLLKRRSTFSGKIPTDLGIDYYFNENNEKDEIENEFNENFQYLKLDKNNNELKKILENAANLLSDSEFDCIGIVNESNFENFEKLTKVKIIFINPKKFLAVFIFNNEITKNINLFSQKNFSEEEIRELEKKINKILFLKPKKILEFLKENNINYNLEKDSFFKNLNIDKNKINEIINSTEKKDLSFFSSNEFSKENKNLSLIVLKYQMFGEFGTISILGPKDMDYKKNIKKLKIIKKELEKFSK